MTYNTDLSRPSQEELIALRYIQTMPRNVFMIREYNEVLRLLKSGHKLKE